MASSVVLIAAAGVILTWQPDAGLDIGAVLVVAVRGRVWRLPIPGWRRDRGDAAGQQDEDHDSAHGGLQMFAPTARPRGPSRR